MSYVICNIKTHSYNYNVDESTLGLGERSLKSLVINNVWEDDVC